VRRVKQSTGEPSIRKTRATEQSDDGGLAAGVSLRFQAELGFSWLAITACCERCTESARGVAETANILGGSRDP
jgi:hypothetical protein